MMVIGFLSHFLMILCVVVQGVLRLFFLGISVFSKVSFSFKEILISSSYSNVSLFDLGVVGYNVVSLMPIVFLIKSAF